MQELNELLVENSLYKDDAQKADLIKNDPQLVKDAFWINTLGFFAIQKNFGSSVRNRKYFKQLDKAYIKNIGQDVHDMAAATKMAYDAGFLVDNFTMNFTKLLFLMKQKPDMTIDQTQLRELFNKIVISKIMPSPKIRVVIQKYLAGDAELDDLMFPFFYYARAKKFSEDFQIFTRIFYKSMNQQAMAVTREEKQGKDISKHLHGPTDKKTTVVAVQSASTGKAISAFGTKAPTPSVPAPVAPPVVAKKVYNDSNFNLFDEWSKPNVSKDDIIYLLLSYLSQDTKWDYLDKAKGNPLATVSIVSYLVTNYPTLDYILTAIKGNSEFLSILDGQAISPLNALKDFPKLKLVSNIMRFADSYSVPMGFYGFFNKDGTPNQTLLDVFKNVKANTVITASFFPTTKNGNDREKIFNYLNFKNDWFYLENMDLVSMYKAYPKDHATFDYLIGRTLDVYDITDIFKRAEKGTIILYAMGSKDDAVKKKGFAALKSIVDEGLEDEYPTIPKDIFDTFKTALGSVNPKDTAIPKLKNWLSGYAYNLKTADLTALELAWLTENSIEEDLKDDPATIIKIALSFVVNAFSPLWVKNIGWMTSYFATNKDSREHFFKLASGPTTNIRNPTFLNTLLEQHYDKQSFESWLNSLVSRVISKNGQGATMFGGEYLQSLSSYWLEVLAKKVETDNFNVDIDAIRKAYPDNVTVSNAPKIFYFTSKIQDFVKETLYTLANKDPKKDIAADYKLFAVLRNAFNIYNWGLETPVSAKAFADTFTKYSGQEILKFISEGENYAANNATSYYDDKTNNSILGNLNGGEQLAQYVLGNTKAAVDAFDSLSEKTAEKVFEYAIGGNPNDIGTDQEFIEFVKKARDKISESAYDKIVYRSSYDTAYFRLVDSGLVKPHADGFANGTVYGIGDIVNKAKDANGKIRAPEELMKVFEKHNRESYGGLGDVYYRFEPMIDALGLREITDTIMNDDRRSPKDKEKAIDKLFSSINIGRKGNDRKAAIATKVICDRAIRGSLLEANETSLIPIAVKLDANSMLEIFKFNNFTVELPTHLKIGKKKSIAQVYNEANTWKPNIPSVLVSRVVETPEDLERKSVEYSKYYNDKHGDIGLKFLESFEVNMDEPEEFKEFILQHPTPTVIPAFHGTGSVAASMILRFGFKVVKKAVAGVNVAGKMLGDGIYFSNIVSKTAQYLGDAGFNRKVGTVGYLLEMDAYIGKTPENYKAAGLGGKDSIKSPEWCVFDARAQLKIKKAHKVMIVKGQDIRDLKKIHPSVLTEDRYFKGFSQFLTEERVNMKKSTTFIFYDGNIPNKEGKLEDFEAWVDKNAKGKISFMPGQYGPEITIEHNKSGMPQFVHIPDSNELVNNDPEGLFTVWKKIL